MMAQTPAECVGLVREAERQERILQIFLECRYLDLYTRMKQLVEDGEIGRVMAIQTAENLGYWHFIMSYVRGFARRSADASRELADLFGRREGEAARCAGAAVRMAETLDRIKALLEDLPAADQDPGTAA